MFYVLTPPDCDAAMVYLYPTRGAAIAKVGDNRPVYAVAVEFDKSRRRLVVPLWVIPQTIDEDWTTPAELHGDGSITAKGTIPRELFVGRVNSASLSASVHGLGGRPAHA
jgi:hypothetical protein